MLKEGINTLSLFDGMSCGQLALQRLGIKVNRYYASEIDPHAIKVTKHNFPNTVHLGSVIKVDVSMLQDIGLLIGGSPCQSFSFAGKMKGMSTKSSIDILTLDQYLELKEMGFAFEGQSYLFWEYVRVLRDIQKYNPDVYFLLENVKMVKKWEDLISDVLGVKPIKINSALVSAQNRNRLYWTNIKGVKQPKDKGILLKDIVHENTFIDRDKSICLLAGYEGKATVNRYFEKGIHQYVFDAPLIPSFNTNPSGKGLGGNTIDVNNDKAGCLMVGKGEGQKIAVPKTLKLLIPEATVKGYAEAEIGDGIDLAFLQSKTRRGRLMRDKSNSLMAKSFDYYTVLDLQEFIVPFDKTLQILDKEVEKGKVGFFRSDSQANRVYYIHNKAFTLCGEAGGGAAKMGQYLFGCISPDHVEKRQNGQRFNEGQKFYTLTCQNKHGILIEGYIRKLTPIECERLQTVPDNYTAVVSNSQRYKMLGNGWTVDVVVGILDNLQYQDIYN